MINEDKVILMTRMASYEAGEGKKDLATGRYFRSDYITLQLIKAIFSGTLAFIIIIGVMLLYDFDAFMKSLYEINLLQVGKDLVVKYLISVGLYTLIVYIVSAYRYNRARHGLKTYYGNLRRLSKYYE